MMIFALADISLTLQRPWWLLGMALVLAPLWVARSARRRGRPVQRLVTVGRCMAVGLVVTALCDPVLVGLGRSARPWLVLQDASASVRESKSIPVALPAGMTAETFYWGQGLWRDGERPAPNATELAGVLRLVDARAEAGRLGGVIIQTDGRFADEDWLVFAQQIGRRNAPVLIVPMTDTPDDARIVDVRAQRGREDEVVINVNLSSNRSQRRTLTVRRTDPPAVLLERPMTLLADQPTTIQLTDRLDPGRAAEIVASLDAADAFDENDRAATVVLPRQQHVAVVSVAGGEGVGDMSGAVMLPAASAPTRAADWMGYEAVVLIDADGQLLAAPQRKALAEYVCAGGGLVLVGSGPRDAAADLTDPLNRVAALVPNVFERRPLAVTIVLDASGSMAEPTAAGEAGDRFEQARQAVLAMRDHLTRRDSLAVIVFSDGARRVYDSGTGSADFHALDQALSSVRPAGPTDVWPALQLSAPPGSDERERLIIVVSDLQTEPFDLAEARSVIEQAGALLAVVGVHLGGQPTERSGLSSLAEALDAPLVETDDLSQLASIFGQFVRRHRGPAIREGSFDLPAGWAGLDDEEVLSAYVLCAAANDQVEVLGRIDDDPVAAVRHVGLGRSAGIAILVRWDGTARPSDLAVAWDLVRRILTEVRRPTGDSRYAGSVTVDARGCVVRIDSLDEDVAMAAAELTANVWSPVLPDATASYQMTALAPGRYEKALADDGSASWVTVTDQAGRVVWRGALPGGYARELRAVGVDWESLRQLARATGGRILVDAEDLSSVVAREAPGQVRAWVWLLAAALGLSVATWLARARLGG
ncbi:MAG: VWA domain-containing protein [Planctomycetota bacterium]